MEKINIILIYLKIKNILKHNLHYTLKKKKKKDTS
jgi:hypothetical protein